MALLRGVAICVVASSLLAGGCGGNEGTGPAASVTPAAPAEDPEPPVAPAPTPPAGQPSTPPSAAPTWPSPSTTRAGGAPPTTRPPPVGPELLIGISVHVEGYHREAVDDEQYYPHRDAIVELARVAEDLQARLTFELSRAFVEGAARRGDDVAGELQRRGHAVAVHADVGGEALAIEPFVAELRSRRLRLLDLGVDTRHVSGVCSEGPWVEAAIEAGFESATGFVEFCLKSLDELPPGFEHVAECETPRDCHGTPVVDTTRKMRPWRASSAADWLTPDPGGGLVMIAGDSAATLQCLAESVIRDCRLDENDADAFAALVGDYLAARRGPDLAVCTISWSIGESPPARFAQALFAAVAPYLAAGEVAWATLPEMAAAVP